MPKAVVVDVEASSGSPRLGAYHDAESGTPTRGRRGSLQKMRSFNPFKVLPSLCSAVLEQSELITGRLQRQQDFGFNPEVLAAQKVTFESASTHLEPQAESLVLQVRAAGVDQALL